MTLIISFSFTTNKDSILEFVYPKGKKQKVIIDAEITGKLNKEWRGQDYYYSGIINDSINFSLLYYKLNKSEKKLMVDPFGGMISPGIPMIFFTQNSKLKPLEKNSKSWGEMTDDFMFRDVDLPEFNGLKINQKHMYAYGMMRKDLFVNVHLSKTNCSSKDSIVMTKILTSLMKKK